MIKDSKTIYICAPAGYASGGPEALHQLAHALLNLKRNVMMFYYGAKKDKITPRHQNYKIYDIPYITDISEIKNDPSNLVIIPEAACQILNEKKIDKTSKSIWWLSVDFFFKNMQSHNKNHILKKILRGDKKFPSFDQIKEMKEIIHIPNSYYTQKFLIDNKLNHTSVISDYLNFNYLTDNFSDEELDKKQDLIIYNPAKNGDFLNKIRSKTSELEWVPIQNMTQVEVKKLMNSAKIYIDFGFHPGRERMPREACLAKCCLIIGKDGAAKYKQDMPIMDYYHFESKDENIEDIVTVIHDCLNNYQVKIKDFYSYEVDIRNAEARFNKEVKEVF